MRIGLPGTGTTVDQIIRSAERAETDGLTRVWYTSAVAGDPPSLASSIAPVRQSTEDVVRTTSMSAGSLGQIERG
jgi:hypothetical protein